MQIPAAVNRGYIAFTTILVTSAVLLSVVLTTSLIGIAGGKTSLSHKYGVEARVAAYGCLEESLLRLRNNINFSGGTLSVGSASCSMTISGTGSTRTITVDSTLVTTPSYIKHLTANVKRLGNSINLISVQEN